MLTPEPKEFLNARQYYELLKNKLDSFESLVGTPPVTLPAVAGKFVNAYDSTTGLFAVADAQPLDGDLTSLASATRTDSLYYREAANLWSPVTIGPSIRFQGGQLSAFRSSSEITPLDTVASAPTIDLTLALGNQIDVTGVVTISAITLADGVEVLLRFPSGLTLTNSTSLVLPGGANIIAAANSWGIFRGGLAGVVTCVSFSNTAGYSTQTFDNIFMNNGANIGFAPTLTSNTFDIGNGAGVSSFWRFTSNGGPKLVGTGAASLNFDLSSLSAPRNLAFEDMGGTVYLQESNSAIFTKYLGYLTTNGFVKTSGGSGTLSVDTTAYGEGSVTNFSAGDLPPLFTTTEATTTTTPALTFALSSAAANTFFGNGTGGSATPTFMSAATAKTALGLVIGTNVQAWAALLDSWAAITRASGFDTFTATPSSANLRALLTDENGTGVAICDSNTGQTLATPVINGLPTGTGVASAATASTLAARDANGNVAVNNISRGFLSTVTSATPFVLTVASAYYQNFTGSTAQEVDLPVASTLPLGWAVVINNNTGAALLTVKTSGGTTKVILAGKTTCMLTCILASGTGVASWQSDYSALTATNSSKLSLSGGFTVTIAATQAASLSITGAGGTLNTFSFAPTDLHDETATSGGLSYGAGSTNPGAGNFGLIGDLICQVAGKGLQLQSGTGARAGNATLVAGTTTVTNATVDSTKDILLMTRKTAGGTIGMALTYTLSNATSFTINSDNILDASTISYMLVRVN